ncbi:hypothetical protein SAMN05216403_105152 [Nitrosospira multiformis ATCC 25196]|uniref:Uncharacterized protein n=1 Tax=Nitrosospira multiformis (strain ATCC 25196 / NCIMB 11849 / C 71) TaxID=323848 RepID=A0A1H5TXK5_NITMU|nr:hypothetical protein SAMN05216403_105152 [Nitrosospira multiformis ATCC 25196]
MDAIRNNNPSLIPFSGHWFPGMLFRLPVPRIVRLTQRDAARRR